MAIKNIMRASVWLLVGVASGSLLAVDAAWAQAPSAPEAGSGNSNDNTDDIIVTARRVEENLQDVPISMTVLNQSQINNQNIAIARDLATYIPSLSINEQYGPEKSSFAIRGFNQDTATAPTVGVYFADVVGVRAQSSLTSGNTVAAGAFTDLQSVQVLKGPQGTLFGRNTTGGTILVVPQKPTRDFEGYVEATLGNLGQRRVEAALNVPLADTVRLRASLDRNERDGFMNNKSGIGPKRYNDTDYIYGRLSIVADLTPDLENYTIGYYSKSDTVGYGARVLVCDRNAPAPGQPGFSFTTFILAGAACDQIDRQAARGDSLLDVEVNAPNPYLKIEQWQLINTTTWQVSDKLRVKNIVSYGEFRERTQFSLYSDNFAIAQSATAFGLTPGRPFQYILFDKAPGGDGAGESTITEELQFQGGAADDSLVWVLGGYLEFSRPIGFNTGRTSVFADCDSPATLNCTAPLGFGIISNTRNKYNFDNHGIFAQATYKFTDQLALTLGGRYTFDTIVAVNEATRFNLDPAGGAPTQICNDTLRFNVPDGPDSDTDPDPLVVNDPSLCRLKLKEKSTKPTWLINLDYKPSPDVMLYGKWARGYRQGGINFSNIGQEAWNPETIDSYEIGAKTRIRGNTIKGYVNAAAFYNRFNAQQISGSLIPKPNSGIGGGSVVVNAGRSEIFGIELDSSISFFDRLRLDVGYTYLDTKIKDLTPPSFPANSPFSGVILSAAEGSPMALSPKHRITATATYTLPLAERLGRLAVGATFIHAGQQIADAGAPPEVGILPSTDLLNINVNWDNVLGSAFDVKLFVINATNKFVPVNTKGTLSNGYVSQLFGPPRVWGVRVRYNFGQ
jgi:iron complex outermembrane recepter protein